MKLSCPGKVFITGEYACIEGGPSLVGTIEPLFSLELVKAQGAHTNPFNSQSPAGLYLGHNRHALDGFHLKWTDPYETPVGVGSSSAQFLLSVAAVCEVKGKMHPSAAEILALYWETVGSSQGLRPSGVDVVAQWLGGPVVARNAPFEANRIGAFDGDGEFLLAFTGSKARTHEHLVALKERGFPGHFGAALDALNAITLDAVEAWETDDAESLGHCLSEYQRALLQGGLASAEFSAQVARAAKIPGVLGAKGSGAQGGDCVLLVIEKGRRLSVDGELKKLGWAPVTVAWSCQGVTVLGSE